MWNVGTETMYAIKKKLFFQFGRGGVVSNQLWNQINK